MAMWIPAALAGVFHGLGLAALLGNDLADGDAGLLSLLLAVLGMDAVHLVLAVAAVGGHACRVAGVEGGGALLGEVLEKRVARSQRQKAQRGAVVLSRVVRPREQAVDDLVAGAVAAHSR